MNESVRRCPTTITEHIRPAMVSLVVTFMPVSAIGNLVIIVAVGRTKSLRTNINILIASVATIDIFSTLCLQPLDVLYYINFPNYPHSPTITKLWNALFFALVTSSVFSLCAINLERFIALKFALNYLSWITTERICFCIAVIWSYAMLTFIVIALIQETPTEGQFLFLVTNQFYIALLVVNIIIPMFISFLAAMYISAVARRHLLQIRNMGKMYNLSGFRDTLSSSSKGKGRCKQTVQDVDEEDIREQNAEEIASTRWQSLLTFHKRFKKLKITRERSTSSLSTATEERRGVDYECPIIIKVKMIEDGKESAKVNHNSSDVEQERGSTFKELNVSTLPIGKIGVIKESSCCFEENNNSVSISPERKPISLQDRKDEAQDPCVDSKNSSQTLSPKNPRNTDMQKNLATLCLNPNCRVINVKPQAAVEGIRAGNGVAARCVHENTISSNNEQTIASECSSAFMEDFSISGGIQLVNRRPSSCSTQRYRRKKAVKKWSHLRREFKTLRLVVILSFCFFLCWCPFLINQFLIISNAIPYTCLEEYLDLSLGWLTYWNSVINVFIYAGFNTDFRKSYTQLICGLFKPRRRDEIVQQIK